MWVGSTINMNGVKLVEFSPDHYLRGTVIKDGILLCLRFPGESSVSPIRQFSASSFLVREVRVTARGIKKET